MFSQEDSLVNHSVLQVSERERKITAISGAKCYEQYGKFSPLGLLVKTLLESSRWFSPARRLKWDVQTICSMRISYTERSSNSQLKPSVKTLSVQDILSSRLLFRLVPSEHHTEEIGYGLLPTVQTQGLKVCNKEGKTEFLSPRLLPTPTAIDKGTGRINKSLSKNAKERPTLAKCAKMQLLPTPNASDGTKWTTKYNANSQMGKGLTAMACSGLLLTPTTKANLAEQIAHKVGGGTSQLNPLYVAEMMGYPLEWLTLPFLSQNGEAKASNR